MELADKKELIRDLQQQILALQGCHSVSDNSIPITGLGQLERVFPQNTFPLAAVHEFLSYSHEDAAATNAFISGLLSRLNGQKAACAWISTRRTVFPPALRLFGIDPSDVIFIDMPGAKEALWAMEEALKCEGLSLVVGEFSEISFTQSRRLQLAVEHSRATGFIHRFQPRSENTVACVSRWKIRPLPSVTEDGLPGMGISRWQVDLVKVRNGRPQRWQVEWTGNGFSFITSSIAAGQMRISKVG